MKSAKESWPPHPCEPEELGKTSAGYQTASIGSSHTPLNLESAQYIIYNLTIVAQAMGWGCRNMVGNQAILNRNGGFRKVLNLNKADRIFGLVGIGYPSAKYLNKVEGRKLPIQWNGEIERQPTGKSKKKANT